MNNVPWWGQLIIAIVAILVLVWLLRVFGIIPG